MNKQQLSWIFAGLIVVGAVLLIVSFWRSRPAAVPVVAEATRDVTATPTATPESFLLPFPTKTSAPAGGSAATAVLSPSPSSTSTTSPLPTLPTFTSTPAAATATHNAPRVAEGTETAVLPSSSTPPPAIAPSPALPVPGYHERFGTIGGNSYLVPAIEAGLPIGHFMNWRVDPTQPRRAGVQFWHMVRLGPWDGVRTSWNDIDRVLAEQPGAVWIIGNEPDVLVQDSLTPQTYARLYHELHTYIKERDPAALVAIAGVAQPTPLRRAYLDEVLNAYRSAYGVQMPIDIWTVHAFILREEAGSWGVGIPPGMSAAGARLYEISEHGNMEIFKQNLIDFRAWMAERGYGDRPLAVTEYGIVMPHDYGYPPEAVATFLTNSFDFLLTAANDTGYAPDDNRLVQWWSWFSLYEAEEGYSTGNLYDLNTGRLTPLGETWAAYVNR